MHFIISLSLSPKLMMKLKTKKKPKQLEFLKLTSTYLNEKNPKMTMKKIVGFHLLLMLTLFKLFHFCYKMFVYKNKNKNKKIKKN